MKRLFIFATIITLFFSACTGFFDMRDEASITSLDGSGSTGSLTNVVFDNSGNIFAVDIFSTYTRNINARTVNNVTPGPLQAGMVTGDIPWLPTGQNENYDFYLTYYLHITQDISLPFIPRKYGLDYVSRSVPLHEKTNVKIHNLMNAAAIPHDELLFDDSYIIMVNNYTTSASLRRGSLILYMENKPGITNINKGESALYKVEPSVPLSNFSVMQGVTSHSLASLGVETLEKGHVFMFEIDESGNVIFWGYQGIKLSFWN